MYFFFQSLGYVFTGLMESVGASRKVFEYMNREPEMPLDGVKKPPINGQIEFNDVHFTYPSRKNNPVLQVSLKFLSQKSPKFQGLNLSIPAGQTVALVGPSGGGKSSIVALLEHFYEPHRGQITLDDVPIKDINHIFLHQKVSQQDGREVARKAFVRPFLRIIGTVTHLQNPLFHFLLHKNLEKYLWDLQNLQKSSLKARKSFIDDKLAFRPAIHRLYGTISF